MSKATAAAPNPNPNPTLTLSLTLTLTKATAAAASSYVAANTPPSVRVIYLGYSAGDSVRTGAVMETAAACPAATADNPCRHALEDFHQQSHSLGWGWGVGGRSSYDPLTTLFAVRGLSVEGMGLSECDNCDGTNSIDPANGRNQWVAGPPSNQSYVVLNNRQTAQDALDALLCQPRLADLPSPPAQPPALPPPALPSPTAASTNTDSSGHAHKHKEKSQDGGVRASAATAADGAAATRGAGAPTANLPLTVAVAVTLLLALAVPPHGQSDPLGHCPCSSSVPPQGTPGGSGQLGTSRGSDRLTGRPATASVARASRLHAYFTAF